MIVTDTSPLTFKYLNLPHALGGRGGVQRFFLLSQNIPFGEQLITYDDKWVAEKERLVTSGENPCGSVPIIYAASKNDKDDQQSSAIPLIQHIAASRYLAQIHKVTSECPHQDYIQDLVADEYQGFRDKWVHIAFAGTDDEKKTYREDERPKYLTKFNQLYQQLKTHETYLSVSKRTGQPLWGDAAIFGLLRDNMLTGFVTVDELKETYPELFSLYTSYEQIPSVKEWIDAKAATLSTA